MIDYLLVDICSFDVEIGVKDVIWENFLDVVSKVDVLKIVLLGLQVVVEIGDESVYCVVIGKIGVSCKLCYDDYKKD